MNTANFRDQCIDGSGLPLLTEDHLVNSLGMKLGPALKLRSLLAKKLGGPCPCVSCVAQVQHVLALQANNKPTTSTGIAATTASLGSPLRSNTSKICSEINSSGNICNSHIQENSLIASFNMSNNNCAYQNTETSSSEANSTYIKADCCVKIDEAVKRDSNCDTNIGNLTSPSLQEDHNQEQYPSQNNCNKSGSNFGSDNIGNSVTNRHDNLDSSSSS